MGGNPVKFHRFKINEREQGSGRENYWYYVRRFLHIYTKEDKDLFQGHLEIVVRRKHILENLFAIRFHIGNAGSETPWDGHLTIFGLSIYWGHSAFWRFANWLTRCKGSKWDSRDWQLRISDGRLWWEFANHTDTCTTHRSYKIRPRKNPYRRRTHTWRRGSINLSIPEAIWGSKRYSYEDVDSYPTTIKMPEGEYAVIIKLQKQYFGRTKVAKHKHSMKWVLDVDSPKGIPSHYDKSGGWKGDRTYGFGVDFKYPKTVGWQQDAENAVTAWVYRQRGETGFREPLSDEQLG